MKKLFGIVLVVAVFCFYGCESMPDDSEYKVMANLNDFDYFFPSDYFTKTFATIDEAYEYVKSAQFKFASSSGKVKTSGLSAKLSGTPIKADQPVILNCRIVSQDKKSDVIDPSKTNQSMESIVRTAVSTHIIFLVFYDDREIALPAFYLQRGYKYTTGNQQIKTYRFNDNEYIAEYPVGWSTEKAFSYLKKEID